MCHTHSIYVTISILLCHPFHILSIQPPPPHPHPLYTCFLLLFHDHSCISFLLMKATGVVAETLSYTSILFVLYTGV